VQARVARMRAQNEVKKIGRRTDFPADSKRGGLLADYFSAEFLSGSGMKSSCGRPDRAPEYESRGSGVGNISGARKIYIQATIPPPTLLELSLKSLSSKRWQFMESFGISKLNTSSAATVFHAFNRPAPWGAGRRNPRRTCASDT